MNFLVPLIHYTALLNLQEDEKFNKFESSSKMNDTTKLDNTQMQYEAPEEERTMSKLELVSMDRHNDNSFIVDKTAYPVNDDLSIESGRLGLINNPVKNAIKKQTQNKGLGKWDKDYK